MSHSSVRMSLLDGKRPVGLAWKSLDRINVTGTQFPLNVAQARLQAIVAGWTLLEYALVRQ